MLGSPEWCGHTDLVLLGCEGRFHPPQTLEVTVLGGLILFKQWRSLFWVGFILPKHWQSVIQVGFILSGSMAASVLGRFDPLQTVEVTVLGRFHPLRIDGSQCFGEV
jgi:hypothetical protein